MTRELVSISRYSPGNMSPESLETLFVGRELLLADILQQLTISATTGAKHFILLVGPRGSGKTHLLALLHHRLQSSDRLRTTREGIRVAFLNEDEWGIASYLDLLLRILQAIQQSTWSEGLAERIESLYTNYERDPSKTLITAEQLIVDEAGDKTLLLICENLLEIFRGIGSEGQKRFRAFIQEHPLWTILATTPSLFSGVQLQKSPFYGFFTIRHLDSFDLETTTRLLIHKARLDDRSDLADFLQTPTGRARARAVHYVAGGNPRVCIIMSDFLTRTSLDDLVEPFMRMADDLTPYYQDRIRQLAPCQRKIVEFLCRQPHPALIKDIAERTLVTHQTASKQLVELTKLGLINKTRHGRDTYCELAEPLMRICIEVKDNRTRHLRLFVDFLRHWFSRRELTSRLEAECSAPKVPSCNRLHLEAAVRECARERDEPFLDALSDEARKCLENNDCQGLAEIERRLVEERGRANDYRLCVYSLRRIDKADEAIEIGFRGIQRHPKSLRLRGELVRSLADAGRCEDALEKIEEALRTGTQDPPLLCDRGLILLRCGRYEDAIKNTDELLAIDPEHYHALLHKAEALQALGRLDEALAVAKEALTREPDFAPTWTRQAAILAEQSRFDEALRSAETALSFEPESLFSSIVMAEILCLMDRHHDALSYLDRVVERTPNHVRALCLRASCLSACERFQECITACDRLLAVDPGHGHAYCEKAHCLHVLGYEEEVVSTIQQLCSVVEGDPKARAVNLKRSERLLMHIGHYGDALKVNDLAVTTRPDEWDALIARCEILLGLGRVNEAAEIIDRLRSSDGPAKEIAFVECLHAFVADGPDAGVRRLKSSLPVWERVEADEQLVSLVSQFLLIEVSRHGAVAMARHLKTISEALVGDDIDKIVGGALTRMLSEGLHKINFADDEWHVAIRLIDAAVAGKADCEIPLRMLSAAIRYLSSRDESVLLELPLEERTLLLERCKNRLDRATERKERNRG